ncbi:MAG: aspartate/glutamate racemase family protein [Pseudomonadota bacterium]
MKTIGLLGGMSWESSQIYYRLINQHVRDQLGGLTSAPIVMMSVNLADLKPLQHAGDWEAAGAFLAKPAMAAEAAGAELLAICSNTMHKVADAVSRVVSVPLVHIADASATAIKTAGIDTVGLLGTRFTMEQAFYRDRLESLGVKVLVPAAEERNMIHNVIFDELFLGVISDASREKYLRVISNLSAEGAQGMILGCTEIGLLVDATHTATPLFDTAAIHAEEIVRQALAD